MGRFREALSDDDLETAIDMSPLIDCVFILLIFFIVTTVFVEETGVEVDKPQAASSVQLEKTSILIAITESGQVVYDNQDIGIGGVQRIVRQLDKASAAQPATPLDLSEADQNRLQQLLDTLNTEQLQGRSRDAWKLRVFFRPQDVMALLESHGHSADSLIQN